VAGGEVMSTGHGPLQVQVDPVDVVDGAVAVAVVAVVALETLLMGKILQGAA